MAALNVRPDLPTLWFDTVRFATRHEKDGSQWGVLFFFQAVPGMDDGARFEIARMMSSVAQMKAMTDVMCKLLNHYPERPRDDKPKGG